MTVPGVHPIDLRIDYIGDHVRRALANLPSQFRGQTRIEGTVEAVATQIQLAEDFLWGMIVSDLIDMAWGPHLDQWAAFVGEPLPRTLSDPEFRVFVKARWLARNGGNTIPKLLEVWRRITAPSVNTYYRNMAPGGHWFQVVREGFMGTEHAFRVGRLMRDTKQGAKTLVLVEAVVGYLGAPDEAPDSDPEGTLARML